MCSFFDAVKGEITLKDIDGLLLEKIGQIEQSGSRVLLISSARDFHADPIYPTPVIEFPSSSKNNQYMNGDPAFINVSRPVILYYVIIMLSLRNRQN